MIEFAIVVKTMDDEKENLVISIGGSILQPEDEDVNYIKSLSALLLKNIEDYNFYIVIGGGKTARKYIQWGRSLGADESSLDDIGISSSRLNARLLIAGLGQNVYPKPAKNFDEAMSAGNHYPIVTMGGTHPGHTTDAVAAMLAEKLGSERFINATSVDGVYTADPNKDKEAKKIEKLGYDKLIEIVSKSENKAGPNVVIDPLAAKIIKRAELKTYVLEGNDLDCLENAISDQDFSGSLIEK